MNAKLAARGESGRYRILPGLSAYLKRHEQLEETRPRHCTEEKYLAASECLATGSIAGRARFRSLRC